MLSGQVAKASPEVKIQRRHGNTQPTGPQTPLSQGAKRCTSSFMSVANGQTGNLQAAMMNLKTSSRQSAQPEFITLAAWRGHWRASPWLALLLLPLGHNCGTNRFWLHHAVETSNGQWTAHRCAWQVKINDTKPVCFGLHARFSILLDSMLVAKPNPHVAEMKKYHISPVGLGVLRKHECVASGSGYL